MPPIRNNRRNRNIQNAAVSSVNVQEEDPASNIREREQMGAVTSILQATPEPVATPADTRRSNIFIEALSSLFSLTQPRPRNELEELVAATRREGEQQAQRPITDPLSLFFDARFKQPQNVSPQTRCRSTRRLQRELLDLIKEPVENCTAKPDDDNIYHWTATVTGPLDTPYEGGIFRLNFEFPGNYPLYPPVVKFATKMFHCNISANGYVCMDVLKERWSPVLTITKVLLSLQILLAEPNPDYPFDPNVAGLYKNHREIYNDAARKYTMSYANPQDRP